MNDEQLELSLDDSGLPGLLRFFSAEFYIFTMYQFAGKWKIAHLHWDETLEPLEKVAPSHFLAQ